MNGKIVRHVVEPGQRVKKARRIALMEAMKMEHSLTAPMDGIGRKWPRGGQPGGRGAVIARIEADEMKD